MSYEPRKIIGKSLSLILANCNRSPSDSSALMDAWHIGLEDIEDDRIAYGAKKCIMDWTSSFIPTVSQFREYCMSSENSMSLDDQAAESWALSTNNLSSSRSYMFKDSAISETLKAMGGLRVFSETKEDQIRFLRTEFIKLYKIYKNRNMDYDPRIGGIYGFSNASGTQFVGYEDEDDPKKIFLEYRKEDKKAEAIDKILRLQHENLEIKNGVNKGAIPTTHLKYITSNKGKINELRSRYEITGEITQKTNNVLLREIEKVDDVW